MLITDVMKEAKKKKFSPNKKLKVNITYFKAWLQLCISNLLVKLIHTYIFSIVQKEMLTL